MEAITHEETIEQLKAKIAQLEADNKAQAIANNNLKFKIGDKGAISVYGLQRFPVTLYYDQWMRLLDAAPELTDFLEEHRDQVSTKPKPLSREEKALARTLDYLGTVDPATISPTLAARMATLKEKLGK